MDLTLDVGRESDDRWFTDVLELPGVITYGATRPEAISKAKVLALRVIADRLEHGEAATDLQRITFALG